MEVDEEDAQPVRLLEDLRALPLLEGLHQPCVGLLDEPGQAADPLAHVLAEAGLEAGLAVRQVEEREGHQPVQFETPVGSLVRERGLGGEGGHLEAVVLVELAERLREGVDGLGEDERLADGAEGLGRRGHEREAQYAE